MAHPLPPVTTEPGARGHRSTGDGADNMPYTIWQQLQRHRQFNEYRRQIRACLQVPDDVWYHFYCLRTDPHAVDFINDLHLSIHLVPCREIWNLVVCLRMHHNWQLVRSLVVSQMNQNSAQSNSTASAGSSLGSHTSYAHLSSASARTSSNAPSSFGFVDTLPETGDEEIPFQSPQVDNPRATHIAMTGSGKVSKMAPEGMRFTCPYKQCRGEYAFRRLGDFTSKYPCLLERSSNQGEPSTPFLQNRGWADHIHKRHEGAWDVNPYHHLKKDVQISTPHIPLDAETADNSANLPEDSPSSFYPEVIAVDDFPATGPEYHLPMRQDSMMPHAGYYGNTGVYNFKGGDVPAKPHSRSFPQQGTRIFKYDDNMNGI